MKTRTTTTVKTTALAMGLGALLAAGTAVAQAGTAAPPSPAAATSGAAALAFNREEERMARDLYAALAEYYDGALPFSRITMSEQRHFEAVGRLLETHAIADPASGRAPGSYADPVIQDLYDGWLAEGKTSLNAAYQVGIELEKRDIADLQSAIADSDLADVDAVLGSLLKGSTNHLRAFENAAAGGSHSQPGQGGSGTGGPRMGGGQGRGGGPGAGQGQGAGPGPGCRHRDSLVPSCHPRRHPRHNRLTRQITQGLA